MSLDIVGLGNALVDALVLLEDDAVLGELGLTRGTMHPVDDARWREVYARVGTFRVTMDAGGSCANAIATAGLLGASARYCGRVGEDELGQLYARRMEEACGGHALQWTPRPTGKVLSMISPDAERTMVTDLGAATSLPDLERFLPLIDRARVTHFTGYTLFDPQVAVAVRAAMAHAQQVGSLVSLDAADPIVVKIQRDLVWELVEAYADLVFLNDEEASMLAEAPVDEAIRVIGERMGRGTVVVKLGKRGSMILHGGELHHVDVVAATAVDSTGAGDSYAGAYLYGITQGWEPARCGALASHVASRVVSQVGARLDRNALRDIVTSA